MDRVSQESNVIFKGELNEDNLIDKEKSNNKFSLQCKLIISLIIILLLFIILILIIVFTKKDEKEIEDYYAKISCIFNVLNHSELLPILSQDFPEKELKKFDIYINGSKLKKNEKFANISSNGIIRLDN